MENPNQQRVPSPREAKLLRCSHVSCPGLGNASDRSALCVGGEYLHSFCVAVTVREIKATNATVMDDKPLCSVSCYCFTLIDGLTADTVTSERVALVKKNKEQLKEEARVRSVKVNC
jgi:hypothetical protein